MVGASPKVSLIIVNYNGRHLLGELFDSLATQTRPADEVIMVDNASLDGSVEYVQQHFSWVKVIASKVNTGYAEGNNIGMDNATGQYVALLNSDTVVDDRWLSELVEMLNSDGTIGAAVSKIYLATKTPTIDCAGAEFNNLGFVWGRGTNEPDRGQFDTVMEVPSLTACAALIRRSAVGKESLFDSSLFMYYEEFDLALRLRGRGHSIVYVPTSLVYHKRSQSVQKSSQPRLFHQFYSNRNRVKILAKYYPFSVLLPALPLILLSLIHCDWVVLREGGPRLFLRALISQVHYAAQGLVERFRRGSVDTGQWLPWMTRQGLRDVLALKAKLGTYVK